MCSVRDILKPYSVEEFLTKNWTSKAVLMSSEEQIRFAHLFYQESQTYIFNFHQIKYLEIPSALYEKVHSLTGIDFLEWLVNQLRQQKDWRKSLPLGVQTTAILGCLDNLLSRLNKHVACNHTYNDYISCTDSFHQQIAYYSLPKQAGFGRFAAGTKTKFRNAEFQHVRFSELPEAIGCQITVAGKEVFLKGILLCVVEKLFTTETFAGNDVLIWLINLDWDMDIVPFLSCVSSRRHHFR